MGDLAQVLVPVLVLVLVLVITIVRVILFILLVCEVGGVAPLPLLGRDEVGKEYGHDHTMGGVWPWPHHMAFIGPKDVAMVILFSSPQS